MQSDDEPTGSLVLLASSGDQAAVHELVARYLTPLQDYIRRQCGPDLALLESGSDLVQSVCREVLEGLAGGGLEYRGEAQFRQWLYRAALNKVRMRGRYWQAERRDGDRQKELHSSWQGPVDSETPSRVAQHRENEGLVRAAMARLPADQRRIIEMARFEGLSHRDIAERLGVTESHSRVLLARAMAQLAKLVAG